MVVVAVLKAVGVAFHAVMVNNNTWNDTPGTMHTNSIACMAQRQPLRYTIGCAKSRLLIMKNTC